MKNANGQIRFSIEVEYTTLQREVFDDVLAIKWEIESDTCMVIQKHGERHLRASAVRDIHFGRWGE